MEQVKRKGLRYGVQTEFTLFLRVKPGEGQAIREAMAKFVQDPRRGRAVEEIGTVHDARYVLFDNDTRLMFCSTFDGDWDKYIDDFASTYIATVFDVIFTHCEGFPGLTSPHAKDWFMDNAEEAIAFLTCSPNATVKQIWKALEVQKAFEKVLDDPAAAQALQDPALKPLLALAAT